ncbi:MAG: hypothetical protein A49_14810 [Methyloceanibacter sp.]|nr:MAG: hypothetical protein A49_14810 [Methyloceanibacter sp.]
MRNHQLTLVVTALAALASTAAADVIITLSARTASGQEVSGPVAAGTVVFVDIFASVDVANDPLPDIRLLAFDFDETDETLVLSGFSWELDLPDGSDFYSIRDSLPAPSAVYIGLSRIDGRILDLSGTPTRVATLDVTVNGTGRLDVIGLGGAASDSAAQISANFETPVDFTRAAGNLSGGGLVIDAMGAAVDSDGDGVADESDAFPDDPNETTDLDGDQIGDNADTDDDADGVPDVTDATPNDTDNDGVDNAIDEDDDGDNTLDDQDADPLDPEVTVGGNDNTGGGNTNENDNENSGPRATGGLCAPGIVPMLLASGAWLSGAAAMRRRCRRA